MMLRITLQVSASDYEEIMYAALATEERGEELTAADYVRECVHAGLRRDQKAKKYRRNQRSPECVMA